MEQKVEITSPVSVGDKLYRIDNSKIVEETVAKVIVRGESYIAHERGARSLKSLQESIYIEFHTNKDKRYIRCDIGKTVFLDKKELIQKLVEQL